MKDVETFLRTTALLVEYDTYKGPMRKFLNDFSSKFSSKESEMKLNFRRNLFKIPLVTKGMNFPRTDTGKCFCSYLRVNFSVFLQCQLGNAKDSEKVINVEKNWKNS